MIYGIGSVYGSKHEKLSQFVSSSVACIGWERDQAPALHQLLNRIAVGDIVFVKSFTASGGLYIKAVGVVTSPEILILPDLRYGRSVSWVWSALDVKDAIHLGRIEDRYDNMRFGTLYEELGPVVQQRVVDILLARDA